MQMVEADAASVESRLVAGEIACPGCGGEAGDVVDAVWPGADDSGAAEAQIVASPSR